VRSKLEEKLIGQLLVASVHNAEHSGISVGHTGLGLEVEGHTPPSAVTTMTSNFPRCGSRLFGLARRNFHPIRSRRQALTGKIKPVISAGRLQ
jgi:hypothetical protein